MPREYRHPPWEGRLRFRRYRISEGHEKPFVTRSVRPTRSNSNAWHSSGVSRMGDNRAYSYRDRSDALEAALPARYRSPGRSDLPHLRLELMRRSFARFRHPAASADATGLRVDLIEDEVKPGEEENNKVRRRELLSFFTG